MIFFIHFRAEGIYNWICVCMKTLSIKSFVLKVRRTDVYQDRHHEMRLEALSLRKVMSTTQIRECETDTRTRELNRSPM